MQGVGTPAKVAREIALRLRVSASLLALAASACERPTALPATHDSHEPALSIAAAAVPLCSAALHAQYVAIGPDGAPYPTWHPPTHTPTGCSFGHEHGRDPSGSRLSRSIGKIPFGYVNAVLDQYDPANPRHEDHVGHKIEWQNGVQLQRTLNGRRVNIGVTCDFLMKIHQGTHSADAFTNNLHELQYFVKCSDRTELEARVLSAIGALGEFVRSCDKSTVIRVGPPTPPNSPVGNGVRFIPDISCIDRYMLVPAGQWSQYSLALYEDWITSNYIRTASGQQIAYWDPHFAVFSPARVYDAASATRVGYVIDQCYLERPIGERARGGECDWSTNYGQQLVPWNDPASAFNGVRREFYFNQTTVTNAGGPRIWYTDPFGGNASPTPFPGSIRQVVASINNSRPYPLESQAFGATRNYGSAGTRAPN